MLYRINIRTSGSQYAGYPLYRDTCIDRIADRCEINNSGRLRLFKNNPEVDSNRSFLDFADGYWLSVEEINVQDTISIQDIPKPLQNIQDTINSKKGE